MDPSLEQFCAARRGSLGRKTDRRTEVLIERSRQQHIRELCAVAPRGTYGSTLIDPKPRAKLASNCAGRPCIGGRRCKSRGPGLCVGAAQHPGAPVLDRSKVSGHFAEEKPSRIGRKDSRMVARLWASLVSHPLAPLPYARNELRSSQRIRVGKRLCSSPCACSTRKAGARFQRPEATLTIARDLPGRGSAGPPSPTETSARRRPKSCSVRIDAIRPPCTEGSMGFAKSASSAQARPRPSNGTPVGSSPDDGVVADAKCRLQGIGLVQPPDRSRGAGPRRPRCPLVSFVRGSGRSERGSSVFKVDPVPLGSGSDKAVDLSSRRSSLQPSASPATAAISVTAARVSWPEIAIGKRRKTRSVRCTTCSCCAMKRNSLAP